MQSISLHQQTHLLKRFPNFELSYETVSHKKVYENYQMTLAIPYGKKAFIWFTYYEKKDVCFLLELNKEKKITRCSIILQDSIPCSLAYNTILYGCLCQLEDCERPIFLLEDLAFYEGIPLSKQPFSEKLRFTELLFTKYRDVIRQCSIAIGLPMMWSYDSQLSISWQDKVPYQVHHLQHRSLDKIVPYINIPITKNILAAKPNEKELPFFLPPRLPRFDFSKHQYKYPTCFEIKADIQSDIYHLYSFGPKSKRIYCGVAYIPSYNTSKFMNSLFRTIKENQNLDALEESDDEEEFENVEPNKFVDLQKTLVMECIFQRKFKKWMPTKVIYQKEKGRVVHIVKL